MDPYGNGTYFGYTVNKVGGKGLTVTAERIGTARPVFWIKIKDHEETTARYGTNKDENNVLTGMYISGNNFGDQGSDTTFIAYFAPNDEQKVIVVLEDDCIANGTISMSGRDYRTPVNMAQPVKGRYFYSTDDATLTANPSADCFFVGWYNGDTLISTNPTLNIRDVGVDALLKPVFSKCYKYHVISNQEVHYTDNEHTNPQITDMAEFSNTDPDNWHTKLENQQSQRPADRAKSSFANTVKSRPKGNYEFAYWLKDDGTAPLTDGPNLIGYLDENGQLRNGYNELDAETTFVAFYKPEHDYIVLLNDPKAGGHVDNPQYFAAWNWLTEPREVEINGETKFRYYFAKDHGLLTAVPDDGWYFDGWYDGEVKVSSSPYLNI